MLDAGLLMVMVILIVAMISLTEWSDKVIKEGSDRS